MASPRAAAPAAAACLRGCAAALQAAAASARAGGRVPEASAVVGLGRTALALAAQLEWGSLTGDSPEDREISLRETLSRPALRAKVYRVGSNGFDRAARNLAQHSGFGEGTAALSEVAATPQRAQRGGRRARERRNQERCQAGPHSESDASAATGLAVQEPEEQLGVFSESLDVPGGRAMGADDGLAAIAAKQAIPVIDRTEHLARSRLASCSDGSGSSRDAEESESAGAAEVPPAEALVESDFASIAELELAEAMVEHDSARTARALTAGGMVGCNFQSAAEIQTAEAMVEHDLAGEAGDQTAGGMVEKNFESAAEIQTAEAMVEHDLAGDAGDQTAGGEVEENIESDAEIQSAGAMVEHDVLDAAKAQPAENMEGDFSHTDESQNPEATDIVDDVKAEAQGAAGTTRACQAAEGLVASTWAYSEARHPLVVAHLHELRARAGELRKQCKGATASRKKHIRAELGRVERDLEQLS